MKCPEKWTVLRPGETTTDLSTGNQIPGVPIEVPWRGLLQQKYIRTDQDELGNDVVVNQLVLLLAPGLPGGVDRRDLIRFDGPLEVADVVKVGDKVRVQGNPRARRPARGGRRPAYIAAIVRHSTDM